MCALIAQALEHRHGRTRGPVHASFQARSPDVLDRSPPSRPADRPPAGSKKRKDRLDKKSTCDASERGPRDGEGAVAATSAIGVEARWESDTPKAFQSPPTVRRVTSNNTGRCHRHRERLRGGKIERDIDGSSAFLAEAIGCNNIPTGLRAADFDGGGNEWASFSGHYGDLRGNPLKLESMDAVFRTGLDLGKTRFRPGY